jgi:hypothetical protein
MNAYYPFTTPIILTDEMFVNYGGETGTTTTFQRQAAYAIAEELVVRDLQTFLLPYTVTGTYLLTYNALPLMLDYGYVNSVELVRFIDTEESIYYTVSGTANISASLRDPILGLVDIHWLYTNCSGCSATALPYKIQVVYNAGLATGTANSPVFEQALTMVAESALYEIRGYGNEASGDMGVKDFANQQYRESRINLIRTTLGSSAKMQMVHKLLSQWRKPRYMRLR